MKLLQRICNRFLPLEDSEMDPQEEMPFSKLPRASHTFPCLRPHHASLQEQIRVADFVPQSLLYAEGSNPPYLVEVQHKG